MAIRPEDIDRYERFIAKIQGKEQKGDYEIMALCPVHGDARLSLWVKLKEDGKIVVKCHANCAPHAICEKLGFKLGFLYPNPQIIDWFDYITAAGEFVYQEIKYDKTALNRFQARRQSKKKNKDGKFDWLWNIDGVKRILYNEFEIVRAAITEIIFMCEGAKDARTLLKKGLTSTAAIFNDWIKTNTKPLDDRPVVILQDNDEAGIEKALKAAHDRYGKSSSIKILLLPGLGKGGDVTDWFEAGGTLEKFWNIVRSKNLKEWFPQESVLRRVLEGKMTGMAFEHYFPRPIFLEWLEIFHPPEKGPLYFYDDTWLKGNPETKIYKETLKNKLLEDITQFLLCCYNKQAKGEEDFKPTPSLIKMILETGEKNRDLNVILNPTVPIFQPFFMAENEKNYNTEDIIIMKNHNFYIPERLCFPRNMDACIALSSLPFDYNATAKCPAIDEAFERQWTKDQESKNLLLEFIYYCMKHSHIYKAILCLIGESDSGKSQFLELIRHFIGYDSCEALSMSKMGRPFELYRARNAQLLISDDLNLTKFDLQDGSLLENLKSIPFGAPVRIEKKGGIIYSKSLPCQIILAGNNPPKIPELSSALSNRFYFLDFPHVYKRSIDMNPLIMEKWLPELAGLMNKVLDSGIILEKRQGFLEPLSSAKIRTKFESGANPIRNFIEDVMEINHSKDEEIWFTRIADMKVYYRKWCEEDGSRPLPATKADELLVSIRGIRKVQRWFIIEGKNKQLRGWNGIRRQGTTGHPNDIVENAENTPEF